MADTTHQSPVTGSSQAAASVQPRPETKPMAAQPAPHSASHSNPAINK